MIIAKFGLDSRKKNIGIKIRHPSRLRVKRRGVRRDLQSGVEFSLHRQKWLCHQGQRAARNGCFTSGYLDPVFCAVPGLLQGAVLGAAANPDLAMILEGDRVGMVGLAGEREAGVVGFELLPGAAEDDHALAGVVVGTPEPIILMAGDDRRQAVLAAEVIDRGPAAEACCRRARLPWPFRASRTCRHTAGAIDSAR